MRGSLRRGIVGLLCSDHAEPPHEIPVSPRPIVHCEPLFVRAGQPNRRNAEAYERSLSVTSNFGAKPCFLRSLRISRSAARPSRRRWTSMSSTSPRDPRHVGDTSACRRSAPPSRPNAIGRLAQGDAGARAREPTLCTWLSFNYEIHKDHECTC